MIANLWKSAVRERRGEPREPSRLATRVRQVSGVPSFLKRTMRMDGRRYLRAPHQWPDWRFAQRRLG